ncbi:hypothetical protein [Novisyntrophococcus fermenticellae]|uniref:hypothetical protein n=1 Tax=Novisyntrophococcus fermenticellae TaxID=2068655 RepID=UPI001E492A62|nr:hypothetical protein [Novisyntrophococcus fermenticellae]
MISEIVKAKLTPEAIEKSVEVQKEVNRRKGEQSRFFQLQVEKARYEADIARRRYMNVDPDNRLVSLELESAWNLRLAQLLDTEKQYEDELKRTRRRQIGNWKQKSLGWLKTSIKYGIILSCRQRIRNGLYVI